MKLYTRQEAARYLRIGLRTLDRRIADGELQCHRYGDGPRAQVRISETQLQDYLEKTVKSSMNAEIRLRAETILSSRGRSV